MQSRGLRPRSVSASASPTEVVDLPSPAAVGLTPVTRTSLGLRSGRASTMSSGTLAL